MILDIYSRYVVGWTLAPSESGELAKDLIGDCLTRQQVTPGTLSLHADRDTSVTSKPVSQLLTDRPRKTLGYMTPSEKLAQVVALTA